MKITKTVLKQIIREEIQKLNEAQKMVLFEIPKAYKTQVFKVLSKLGFKSKKDFNLSGENGQNFIIAIRRDIQDEVLEAFIKNNIKVYGV